MNNRVFPLLVRHPGLVDYQTCFDQMRAFTDARDSDTPDELWVVEHPPVYTLGLGADRAHLLAGEAIAQRHIPVIQTDRGGEVTYHGPGQVVIYLLLDLRRHKPAGKLFIRELVTRIEQAVIQTLASYGIAGERKAGAPGIYLCHDAVYGRWQGAKIAALGLKVRGSGCTYHGLSLNVAMDLQPFGWINPCGYAGLATVDMQSIGVHADLAQVQARLVAQLQTLLQPDAGSLTARPTAHDATPAPANCAPADRSGTPPATVTLGPTSDTVCSNAVSPLS